MLVKHNRYPLVEDIFNSLSPSEIGTKPPTTRVRMAPVNRGNLSIWGILATALAYLLMLLAIFKLDVFREEHRSLTANLAIIFFSGFVPTWIYMCFHKKELGTHFNFLFNKQKIYPGDEVLLEVIIEGNLQRVASLELYLAMRERIYYPENPSGHVRDTYKESIYQSKKSNEIDSFTVKFTIPHYSYPSLSTAHAVNNSDVKRYIQEFCIEWCLIMECKMVKGVPEKIERIFMVNAPRSNRKAKVSDESGKNKFEHF